MCGKPKIVQQDPEGDALSDDPQKTMNFLTRSAVQGGGLSILGDILVAGTDTSGRGTSDFMVGPFGSDAKAVLGLTVGNFTQYTYWFKVDDQSGEKRSAGESSNGI